MTDLNSLFSPVSINRMILKNRIVMPAIATNLAGEDGEVTKCLHNYYYQRALGGAGLIIVENTNVDYPNGKAGAYQVCIDGDRFIQGLKRLVQGVHSADSKIALQINHAGGLAQIDESAKSERLAPSTFHYPRGVSRELTVAEIQEIADKFALAALRAKAAQFDAVEIHGAHGYLITQFMSPLTNHRSDQYGGDLEGRMEFVRLVLRKIREAVGNDYPIFFRFSADEFMEGGNRASTAARVGQILEESGVDVIDVSAGLLLTPQSTDWVVEPASFPEGSKVFLAELIKKEVKVPVITVGGIRRPEFADWIIKEGKADLVAIGRGLVADPFWPQKSLAGRQGEINQCTSCKNCFRRRSYHNLPITCAVNPNVGKE